MNDIFTNVILFNYFITYVDIVGAAQNIEPVKHIDTHFGERNFVRFQLYDGRLIIYLINLNDVNEINIIFMCFIILQAVG